MRSLITLLLLPWLIGCSANLDVTVDVFDGQIESNQGVDPQQFEQQVERLLQDDLVNQSSRDARFQDYLGLVASVQTQQYLAAKLTQVQTDNLVAKLASDVTLEWKQTVEPSASKVADVAAFALAVVDEATPPSSLPGLANGINDEIAQLSSAVSKFESKLKALLGDENPQMRFLLGYIGTELTVPEGVNAGIAASASSGGRSVGYPLFNAEIAKVITAAEDPEQGRWVEFVANDFSAWGADAQFVMIREGLVVFHPKSLDFDPSSAVGAGAAASKMGIQIAAAVMSGKFSLPANSGTTDMASSSFNEVTLAQQQQLLQRRNAAKQEVLARLLIHYQRVAEKTATAAATDEDKKVIANLSGYYSALASANGVEIKL